MKKIAFLLTVLCSSACSNKTKHNLGITENLPDEYQVKRNQPLEVPPSYQRLQSKK